MTSLTSDFQTIDSFGGLKFMIVYPISDYLCWVWVPGWLVTRLVTRLAGIFSDKSVLLVFASLPMFWCFEFSVSLVSWHYQALSC